MPQLTRLEIENFRSLRHVELNLGRLNILVGPNGAGKSNVLETLRFLGRVATYELASTVAGAWPHVLFRSHPVPSHELKLKLVGEWRDFPERDGPDTYEMRIAEEDGHWNRIEEFRCANQDHPIHVKLDSQRLGVHVSTDKSIEQWDTMQVDPKTSGLSVLPRLSPEFGKSEVAALSQMLQGIRFFDCDVKGLTTSRGLARYTPGADIHLVPNAENLSAFLFNLRETHPERFAKLQKDAIDILPQLAAIDFEFPSKSAREVTVVQREHGLSGFTGLADASYGTIRLLALLAMIHDPHPPAITCIEDFELGLHPQALEPLVDRLREASQHTQFLIATHSPALVDRLAPEEIVICERRSDGSSAIPAITTEHIKRIQDASQGLPLGDLWFTGDLGGDL